MKQVIFVAPYFMDATERFISAATSVPHSRVALVSCDSPAQLDAKVRSRLAAYEQLEGISSAELLVGIQGAAKQLGSVDRILGILEQIQVPLGEIRQHLDVAGMKQDAAVNFRDKSQMKSVLRSNGYPCARHQLINDSQAAMSFAETSGFPIVVKPPDGAGAKATFRCESLQQLMECIEHLRPAPGNPILLEEFIVGKEHSFDSVTIHGQTVWHSISHYYPAPLEVVQEPWIQWCVMIPRETASQQYDPICNAANGALRCLGLETGLSHMEWFQRDDGTIAISEVGARPPGAQFMTLLSYAHDIDFYYAWANLMTHDEFDPPDRKFACGAAYLRGMGMGRVADVIGLDGIANRLGDLVVEAKIPKAGQPPSGSYEGEGYIIVRHSETEIVKKALQEIITSVRVQMA